MVVPVDSEVSRLDVHLDNVAGASVHSTHSTSTTVSLAVDGHLHIVPVRDDRLRVQQVLEVGRVETQHIEPCSLVAVANNEPLVRVECHTKRAHVLHGPHREECNRGRSTWDNLECLDVGALTV